MILAARKKAVEDKLIQKNQAELSKAQILASAKFQNRRDLLDSVLESGKGYTMGQVEEKIEKFMKGQVK